MALQNGNKELAAELWHQIKPAPSIPAMPFEPVKTIAQVKDLIRRCREQGKRLMPKQVDLIVDILNNN